MGPILGEIRAFAGNFAPYPDWHLCDGSLLAISANTALFSLLGTTYGGDGKTNFALPDLRGRCAIGWGAGPGLTTRVPGEKAGAENVTLTTSQMPAHAHALGGTAPVTVAIPGSPAAANASQTSPVNGIAAEVKDSNGDPLLGYAAASAATGTMADGRNATGTATLSGNTGTTGSSQPHPNMQPYLAITYIIAVNGLYPTRA